MCEMTQVDWHPYPEKKPDFYKPVLVTLSSPNGGRMVEIDLLHFYPSLKKEEWGYEPSDRKIIAWAELPEPYKPKGEHK